VENGIAHTSIDGVTVAPTVVGPADAVVPAAIPSAVEPVSGKILKVRKKPGPKPLSDSVRLNLLSAFVEGKLPAEADKRLKFIISCNLTPREKSYLLSHPSFRDLYDAKLFDLFIGIQQPSRDEAKIMSAIADRLGLNNKKQTNKVVVNNVQMNGNNQSANRQNAISIKVEKAP